MSQLHRAWKNQEKLAKAETTLFGNGVYLRTRSPLWDQGHNLVVTFLWNDGVRPTHALSTLVYKAECWWKVTMFVNILNVVNWLQKCPNSDIPALASIKWHLFPHPFNWSWPCDSLWPARHCKRWLRDLTLAGMKHLILFPVGPTITT